MAKQKRRPANLGELPARPKKDQELIHVIVETPRGSRNKLKYDEELGAFRLKKVLPTGMAFPHDFGFVPSTKGEDGDPVDVLVLMDESAYPGCVVESRLIGVIEGEQTQNGKTERNDRLLAVAKASRTHSNLKHAKELNGNFLDELQAFLINYHSNDGATFKVLGCRGPGHAEKLLRQAQKSKR